ncbi:hypothetical protein ACFL9U_14260 [Thermodesulfobacteriota bacterium]
MMYEIQSVKQDSGDLKKRWFFDHEMDLLVWLEKSDEIVGFQLCYDKVKNPHALTWNRNKGYRYNRVDYGEDKIGYLRGSPILLMNGAFEGKRIAEVFKHESSKIDVAVSTFVYEKILAFSFHAQG